MRPIGRVLVWVAVLWAAALYGADPKETFETLYGGEARKVTAKDSAAFAARLLKDAAELKDDPALAAYLVEKAFDFFLRSAPGEERTAVGETLLAQQLDLADGRYREGKFAEAARTYQQAYQVASGIKSAKVNEINLLIAATQRRGEVEKRVAELEARLKANLNDTAAAKTLVLLHVTELDNPAEGARYVDASGDESLKAKVRLAVGRTEDLTASESKELGDWYRGLAVNASPNGKGVVLARAKACYERFAAAYDKQDAVALAVKRGLDETVKELARLPAVLRPPGTTLPASAEEPAGPKETTAGGGLGTWALEQSHVYRVYWDFKKGGELVQTMVYSSYSSTSGEVLQRVAIDTLKWQIAGKELVVFVNSITSCRFPYPLGGTTVAGESTSKTPDSVTVSKKTLTKVQNGLPEAELAKMLASAKNPKNRTKIPGTWKDDYSGGYPLGGTSWMFCDDGTAIMARKYTVGQMGTGVIHVSGRWEAKAGELLIQAENAEYRFPYPLNKSGTLGKRVWTVYTGTGTRQDELAVRILLESKE
jgi:hypothetical protein